MVELRAAVADDAEVVARIYVESWNEGFGHLVGARQLTAELVTGWTRDLADGAADWTVVEVDGVIAGIVGVVPSRDPVDPTFGELDTIAVDPSRWRRGLGRRLMGHAIEVMQQRWSQAILWTPANYERGHAFYRATGWVPLERRRADGTEVAFGLQR